MPEIISNTSPLLYLHRVGILEWLALDLGAGELSVLTLALENPDRLVLLDDGLARRVAQAAGLTVWGTLKVLLEAQFQGLTGDVESYVDKLQESGMWISQDIRERILSLARRPQT